MTEQVAVNDLGHAVQFLANQLVVRDALDEFAKEDAEKQNILNGFFLFKSCFSTLILPYLNTNQHHYI